MGDGGRTKSDRCRVEICLKRPASGCIGPALFRAFREKRQDVLPNSIGPVQRDVRLGSSEFRQTLAALHAAGVPHVGKRSGVR
jgi:hypothetical protein